jgi:type IV secretory pathway VirB2 component (pilin)
MLGRAGFVARGIQYIVIGVIALQVAFGNNSQQADRTGALHELSSTPFGAVALWILVVGFFGMALWRLTEAAFGSRIDGNKTGKRVLALIKAVVYAVLGYGVLKYALGLGAPQGSNKQSQDLTAHAMQHPGGRIAVIVVGLVIVGIGLFLAYEAWKKKFLKEMELGQLRARTRRIVEGLGRIGGIARGIVFVTLGIFLVVAAVEAKPGQAKGIDSSLRTLAHTPLGPVLLVLVAIGLVLFGLFSCCEARWRKF